MSLSRNLSFLEAGWACTPGDLCAGDAVVGRATICPLRMPSAAVHHDGYVLLPGHQT
jgi:hypothetical protein